MSPRTAIATENEVDHAIVRKNRLRCLMETSNYGGEQLTGALSMARFIAVRVSRRHCFFQRGDLVTDFLITNIHNKTFVSRAIFPKSLLINGLRLRISHD